MKPLNADLPKTETEKPYILRRHFHALRIWVYFKHEEGTEKAEFLAQTEKLIASQQENDF